jgi:hypothetical protein
MSSFLAESGPEMNYVHANSVHANFICESGDEQGCNVGGRSKH